MPRSIFFSCVKHLNYFILTIEVFYYLWPHSDVKWNFQFGYICIFLWNENSSIMKYNGRYSASHTWSNKMHEVKTKLNFNCNMINGSVLAMRLTVRVTVIHSICMIWICSSVIIKTHRYKEGCTEQNLEWQMKFCIRMCVLNFTFGLSLDCLCRLNRKQKIASMHGISYYLHTDSEHKYILLKLT